MKICPICLGMFAPKRKEQKICSLRCRQVANGRKRKGQKTGPRRQHKYKSQINRDGYRVVYAGNHPFAEGRKMIAEHVRVMEMHIGRRILTGECVHHINGDKLDNRLENLELQSHAEHSRMHAKQSSATRKRDARGRFA